MSGQAAPCAFVWHGQVLEVATGPGVGAIVARAPARPALTLVEPAPVTVGLGVVARRQRPAPPRRPTFDAGPLLRQARLALDRFEGVTPMDPGAATWVAVAELLGTSVRQVQRWLTGSRLQEDTADRMATALGLHPTMLWPEWYEVTA